MKCLKCGSSIDDNSKFCGVCGSPIETLPMPDEENNTDNQNLGNAVENTTAIKEKVVDAYQVNSENNKKKNSGKIVFVICAIILAIVAAVLLVLAFNNSSKKSIDSLEKSVNNLVEKGKSSGTISASVLIESNTSDTINASGTVKYQKIGEKAYNLELAVNKSMLFDEMKAYVSLNDNSLSLYIKSSLIDMLMGLESDEDNWINYKVSDLDLDEIDFENEEINLKEDILEKKFKLIGKENGLNHYVLTVDEELLKSVESELESEQLEGLEDLPLDSSFEDSYEVDFYINDYNELQQITMDLSKYLDEEVKKAIITIEFKDFNSTTVQIPSEAINSNLDIETYISEIVEAQQSMEDESLETEFE